MRSDTDYLHFTVEIAAEIRANGNHPFGALLVGPDGDVRLSSGNTNALDRGVGLAEANVARAAAQQYAPALLERCTLVTSVESRAACAPGPVAGLASAPWSTDSAKAGCVRGEPGEANPHLSCHEVFAAGPRHVVIRGPFPELQEEIVNDHKDFW